MADKETYIINTFAIDLRSSPDIYKLLVLIRTLWDIVDEFKNMIF